METIMDKEEVTVLIADDDEGHAALIRRNLKRSGISNKIIHFRDGEEALNFFYGTQSEAPQVKQNESYLLLLDIRMPRVDGIEVLKKLKDDAVYKKIPVIMLTTTDDPREVQKCHEMGCNSYVTKPVDYDDFIKAIQQLGLFLSITKIPGI